MRLEAGAGDTRLETCTLERAGQLVDIRCVMRDDPAMRTTLDLDLDVLQAARELGAARKMTVGQMISELARLGLARRTQSGVRNGVPIVASRGPSAPRVTMERVNALRDEA